MVTYRNLSGFLADVLAEAKHLLELRAEFGRMPKGKLRTEAIKEIDFWFDTQGVSRRVQTEENLQIELGMNPGSMPVPPCTKPKDGLQDGSHLNAENSVPDDGEIPF